MKKRLFRQCISILATLALCLSLLPVTALAETVSNVSYLDADGTSKTCTSATGVTSSEEAVSWTGSTESPGWYVAQSNVTINSEVTFSGDVHLILADGCNLTVNGGIKGAEGASLTIYAQSTGSSIGKLTATGGTADKRSYGIYATGGSITINGGDITATGNDFTDNNGDGDSYGIVAYSNTGTGGSITINGGVVNATGGTANSGINRESCGIYADDSLTINGGSVTATGGNVNGADASGTDGTGHISCGLRANKNITISGSAVVTATAGTTDYASCGIYTNDSLTINGGRVTTTGGSIINNSNVATGSSYGIYAAVDESSEKKNITISGGSVNATGGNVISNSDVATGGSASDSSYGIYAVAESTINISGGSVNATGGNAASMGAMNEAPVLGSCMKVSTEGNNNELVPLEYSSLNSSIYTNPSVMVEACTDHAIENNRWVFIDERTHSQYCTWCGSVVATESHELGANGVCTACGVQGSRYLDVEGKLQMHIASPLTGESRTWSEGWYVAQDNITISGQVTFSGDAHLILADGCNLTVNGGIQSDYDAGASLTIYAQSTGSSMGRLTATGSDPSRGDSIGIRALGGNITINGGAVTANSSDAKNESAGIKASDGGNITINGGAVTANGGAAPGSFGIWASSSTITINGGNVTASGGKATNGSNGIYADSKAITINGGHVTATGGEATSVSYGINAEYASTITISGGHVTARTLAKSVTYSALNAAPNLNYNYYWRTSPEQPFTASSGTNSDTNDEYKYSKSDTYVEFSNGCTYTITLSLNYNGGVSSTVITGTEGQLTETLPAPARSGYIFDGWFTAVTGGDRVTNATVFNRDTTVYAHWTAVSSGGGSSSGSTTTTEKNEDGSTTTTVTDKATGTVTETTKNTDGSTTVVETKKDGTVKETCSTPDGTAGTVVTDSSGTVKEISATVSASAAKEASRTGGAVTLPVEVPSASATSDAPAVEITLPVSSGSVKVEIPVEKSTPGTVAVIVHADGTEKIVTDSIPVEQGVQLKLDGSAVVKVVDNAKDFLDVPARYWGRDGIDFASARGITGGTSDTTFSPGAPCTRDQILTFMWRAAGTPEPENLKSFSDVPEDSYYAKAAAWALENGISTGTGNGILSPDATCTRAQAMTSLYRVAQSQGKGMQGQRMLQNPFNDVDPESYYGEAVMWAVANGITNGTSDTTFSPDAECTRDQIVTFLYRSMR